MSGGKNYRDKEIREARMHGSRRPLVAGNWKMNGRTAQLTEAMALAAAHPGYASGAVRGGLDAPISVYQDSSGLDSWDAYQRLPLVTSWTPGDWSARGPANVSFRGYRTTEEAGVVAAGERMPGWLEVTSSSGGVAVAVVVLEAGGA